MCGIAGILNFDRRPVQADELHSMCEVMAHRGPDEEGFYLGAGVGLGMRRLRIIDLKTGRQPVRNEDGSMWTVLNGEIYNFRDLREDLRRQGHSFYTGTDTETIVHLYEEYGRRCVEKMRGMFAFALWDERTDTLVLARDRLGIKPLYYGVFGESLVFASELKVILQLPKIDRRLNWNAVSHLFTFLTTPPSESIIEAVHKLEPGHLLIASPRTGIRLERYWDIRFEPDDRHNEEYFVERLRALIQESVNLHLVSDVPVGAFLSGGIDSSSVVAAMAGLTSEPVKTFSIGFHESEYNELAHARMVARTFGTDHHEILLEPDVLSMMEDFAWYMDEPFGDSSAIPTYMVSKLASEHVTVVLSGDGGDELFGGYDKYVVEERERKQGFPIPMRRAFAALAGMVPEGVRGHNFLHHYALDGWDRYLDSSTLFRHTAKKRLFRPEVFELFSGYDPGAAKIESLAETDHHWLSAVQYLDLKNYLPLDILTKVDRMSMAHSLEARVPLLDHRLVEFAATIPPELHLNGGTTKYIFKRAMQGIVPSGIINRPKQGFAIPLGRWFRGRLQEFVRDLLLSGTCRRRGFFHSRYIEELLRQRKRGRERDLDLHLWVLISFELWCRTFLDRPVSRCRQTSVPPGASPIRNLTPASIG